MERADLAGQCSPLSSNALGITIPPALLSTADEVIEWPDFPVECGCRLLAPNAHADRMA
jgi:hypothetical protein